MKALMLILAVGIMAAGAAWYLSATAGPGSVSALLFAPILATGPVVGVKSLDWFPYRLEGARRAPR